MTQNADIAVQLYSTRDDLGSRLGSTLERIARIGYTHVEPYNILGDTAALKRGLEATGLKAAAAHCKIIELDREAVVAASKELGIGTVIVPWVDPSRFADRESVAALAAEINDAARFAAGHGIRVGYHNHEFEFSSIVDGRPGWEVMVDQLDPDVVLEVDTYWASVGGADVFELLPRYADRVRYLHVKNEPPDADDPPTLGVDITGRMDEVIAISRGFVELNVVEIVVDGDVFPYLETNYEFFEGVLTR